MTDDTHVADDEDDDSTVEIDLRPPEKVFARVVLLATVLRRLFLESEFSGETGDPEAERFDLANWTRAEGLDRVATRSELLLLGAPLGRIDQDAVDAADWSGAGLVALAWAIGRIDSLPPPEEPFDPVPLLADLPEPWDRIGQAERTVQLRSEASIWHERERADVWHWRAEVELDLRAASDASVPGTKAAIAEVATDAHRAGLIGPPLDGDVSVRGQPFRNLPIEDVEWMATAFAERLRALNWLCGFGSSWDEVPLDV